MIFLKNADKYFSKHPSYNATIHVLIGAGIGMLVAHPVFDGHTVRWGVLFFAVGLIGHLYPWTLKR